MPIGYRLDDPEFVKLVHKRASFGGNNKMALHTNQADANRYVVEEDVYETLPDGRVIQVATKGTGLSLAEARAAGLIKDQQVVVAAENKVANEGAERKTGDAPANLEDVAPAPAGAERAPAEADVDALQPEKPGKEKK